MWLLQGKHYLHIAGVELLAQWLSHHEGLKAHLLFPACSTISLI